MKLGFVSAILDGWSFEEMIDTAAALGFSCVEAACWPQGAGERRYAGVSHIDVRRVLSDDDYAGHIQSYSADKGITLSALAYYPNTMEPNEERRAAYTAHLTAVLRAAAKLRIGMVTTFIGRDQSKTVEQNLTLVSQVWPPILALAEELGVKIAIENCPMLFGAEQWPGGQNLFSTPENWEKIFALLPSPSLGISFDPSHFVWQMMDYVRPVYAFREKIFHVHFKDIKLYNEKLARVGVTAYPLEFMAPKLPGLGDVDWGAFLCALTDIGYGGSACIEVEDRAFEGCREAVLNSLRLSKRYMECFVI